MKTAIFLLALGTLTGGLCFPEAPAGKEGGNSVITSGRVNTLGKFSFTYGRVEASIKPPPTADGLWPAFWLLGADHEKTGWPACGEIDIMEMGGRRGMELGIQDRFLTRGCHWGELLEGGGHAFYCPSGPHPVSLQDDFHLFAMTWDAKKIRMYLDGSETPYFEMNIDVFDGPYPVGNYFHKPFYIILNLAAGGDHPEIYQQEAITALNKKNRHTAAMYVDFVRVYNGEGKLIWEDNFDGPGVDESKWNIEANHWGGGNHELQSYRRGNVSAGREPVSGKNCLVLSARID
jgi:beta-glucanase (GH16 family)